MTPEHTDMTGAARLREALAKLSDCGDWYVRCLQDVRRRVPVRNLDEAEAGYIAALDGAREALAAVPEAPEPVYEWRTVKTHEDVTTAGLDVGDAVEWYLIVSNDGYEWVPGVVEALDPFTVRFWDDDVKRLRPGAATPPGLRRLVGEHRERRTPAIPAGPWERVEEGTER